MHELDRLIGTWHGEGDVPDPPMHLVSDASIERFGAFIVFRSKGQWEHGLGPNGDRWELDFPMTYVRTVT